MTAKQLARLHASPFRVSSCNQEQDEETNMKRRDFVKSALVGGAAASIASPAIAQSSPVLRWRIATSYPKTLATLYGAAEYLSKYVAEATDNNFQIQLFGPGEIVPALQVADACSSGTIEAGHSAGSFNIGKDPAFGIATGLPGGLNARQQAAWQYHAGGLDLLNEFFAGFNLHSLPAGNTGAQPAGWFRKPITSLADMKGLKMRVAGLGGSVLAKLGVVPQQLGAGDIYPALERGTIDAADFVGPYDDEKLGLAKIAPYYMYTSPWEGGGELSFFFNKEKWEGLPKSYKALLTAAAQGASHDMQAKYDAWNPPALVRLLRAGAKPTPIPDDVVRASLVASRELMTELSAKSPAFKKIYDHLARFQAESQPWVAMSDLRYDLLVTNFMNQRQ
jgi:TRAP-type mannitol/chloroaromatic compound transport system substrate-binding protein